MTNVAETEDQYSQFGQHVALQLRELPIRSFVTLQEKIQSLITQERLRIMDMSMTQPSPSVAVHQPFHTATNDYVSPSVIKMNVEGNSYCSATDSLQQQATFFHRKWLKLRARNICLFSLFYYFVTLSYNQGSVKG